MRDFIESCPLPPRVSAAPDLPVFTHSPFFVWQETSSFNALPPVLFSIKRFRENSGWHDVHVHFLPDRAACSLQYYAYTQSLTHYRMSALMLWMPLHADGLARHNPEMNRAIKKQGTLQQSTARQCIATETVLTATFSSWGHLFLTTTIFYLQHVTTAKGLWEKDEENASWRPISKTQKNDLLLSSWFNRRTFIIYSPAWVQVKKSEVAQQNYHYPLLWCPGLNILNHALP